MLAVRVPGAGRGQGDPAGPCPEQEYVQEAIGGNTHKYDRDTQASQRPLGKDSGLAGEVRTVMCGLHILSRVHTCIYSWLLVSIYSRDD